MDESREPTHKLIKDDPGVPLGYYLGVQFHPKITLDEKSGYDFAHRLSDYVTTNCCRFESNGWTLSSERKGLTIEVAQENLWLAGENPGGTAKEWYENRYREVLSRFYEKFEPQYALSSRAMIRQLYPIDGDARDFLASHVMNVNPMRFGPLARPIQLLGLKVTFPPFQAELQKGEEKKIVEEDSQVELRIESWGTDPSKLFVEADSTWVRPNSWAGQQNETLDVLVGRLEQISQYLTSVRAFLTHETGNNPGD